MALNLEMSLISMKCKTYKDHAMLKLAYIDLKDYLSTLQHKHEDLTKQLTEIEEALKESPNSKKNKNKRNQLQQQFDSNERKINQTKIKLQQKVKY